MAEHFESWIACFKATLDEDNIPEDTQSDLMGWLGQFKEVFIVSEGDSGLNTIEQVKKNDLFKTVISQLMDKLRDEVDEIPGLQTYIETESASHKDMLERVAVLLSNKGQEDFGITDDEIDSANQSAC